MDAEAVVERQVAAYNAQDVEAFVACYAPEVEIFELPAGTCLMRGHEAMRERYRRSFETHPGQRARILRRIVNGRFVVDHEEVDRGEKEPVRVIAIYEVEGDRIRRGWFLRG